MKQFLGDGEYICLNEYVISLLESHCCRNVSVPHHIMRVPFPHWFYSMRIHTSLLQIISKGSINEQ